MKYNVPVTVVITGYVTVEIPGKVTLAKKKQAVKLAEKKYDGVDCVECPEYQVEMEVEEGEEDSIETEE